MRFCDLIELSLITVSSMSVSFYYGSQRYQQQCFEFVHVVLVSIEWLTAYSLQLCM